MRLYTCSSQIFEYIGTLPLSYMLLTLLRLTTKKNFESCSLVMKPVGPYRNIKHVALFSQADTKLIFQLSNHFQLSGSLLQISSISLKVVLMCLSKKLIFIVFHPISGLFSMPSLFTYFIKICVDGHGRQSKSPKSKKFYPQASTKIISSCQVHSYKFLLSL